MGGKLVVRYRVCKDCNMKAGKEIDGPFGRIFHVALHRAVHGIPKRGGGMARASLIGDVEGGGKARIVWDCRGGDLKAWGVAGEGQRRIRVRTELPLRLWARFSAKVALATASMAIDERWLDTERGTALRAFVSNDAFPSSIWPEGPRLPVPLPKEDPVAQQLRGDQHLLSVMSVDGEAVVGLILFGVFALAVPLGANMQRGDEIAWLLDPRRPAPEARSYWDVMAEIGALPATNGVPGHDQQCLKHPATGCSDGRSPAETQRARR
jgi:hypothetical protein